MHLFLYRLFIFLFSPAVKLVAPFNAKARHWSIGRKNLLERMQREIMPGNIAWVHCASLGEFEQGRPVMEAIKRQYPLYKLLVTFFSPSGYEVKKHDPLADYVFYLPADTSTNASRFYDIVQPSLAIFIKYEYWYHYLHQAEKRKIPLLLVSGIFLKKQAFFHWYGALHRQMLAKFTWLLVQNEESKQLLSRIGHNANVIVSGDTRFDRVVEIAENFKAIPTIEAFCKNAEVIVAGSTWTEDDKELAHYANSNTHLSFIIAPHDVNQHRIRECRRLYRSAVLYSDLDGKNPDTASNVLIMNNVGMLSRLYKYATVCYVGGGFGAGGVHNVLEAAVYGKPVVFGPEYEDYAEAVELVDEEGGFPVNTALELEKTFDLLLQKGTEYQSACKASLEYVSGKKGATERVLELIKRERLLGV